jgi:hypothetical protein
VGNNFGINDVCRLNYWKDEVATSPEATLAFKAKVRKKLPNLYN